MAGRIKVLVVDDSATVRQTLSDIINQDPELEVIATAADPYVAVRRMREEAPDVITLDIEMPRMDGITFLHKLMQQHPIPVVVCSSLAESGSETLMQAFEAGAVDVIAKPTMGTRQFLLESQVRICDAVKAAAQARLGRRDSPAAASDRTAAPRLPPSLSRTSDKLVAVGASTGGTEALRVLLQALPADSPGVLVVQHMPERFTTAFAARLNGLCAVGVKEAQDGDPVLRGRVLIAPGDRHMMLRRSGARYHVEVRDGPLVSRHRPSVDVLFRSVARTAGANAIGVIMTGMGDDGAKGLLEMREAGAATMAQDEASCVVFGMPKEAIKLGAVERVLSLDHIAGEILRVYAMLSPYKGESR